MSQEHDDDDDENEVGGMQGSPVAAGISPTWTWGSTSNVRLESATPALFSPGTSAQLAQVSLPEPAVCSVYFQADVRTSDPSIVLRVFNIRFSQGVGRTTVVREISYLAQPAPLAPLEVTLPFMTLHALQVDVFTAADFGVAGTVDLQVSLILSPITRIPQKIQKLQFGMALPGEADDMDEELRQDLEAEGPTAAAAVLEGRVRVDGSNDHVREDDDEQEDEDEEDGGAGAGVHPVLAKLIDQLTARHGRVPTRPELRAAVARFKQHQARLKRRRGVR
jgi:hypothetical protein